MFVYGSVLSFFHCSPDILWFAVVWGIYFYLYLSTNLRYFTWIFPFYATLHLYSTTSKRKILYFLLHYICLTAIVTFQITVFHTRPVQWKHVSPNVVILIFSGKLKDEVFLLCAEKNLLPFQRNKLFKPSLDQLENASSPSCISELVKTFYSYVVLTGQWRWWSYRLWCIAVD